MIRNKSSDLFFIIVVCLIGLALRLDLLFATKFVIDSDEAIVGLMAKHIAEGKEFPIFFYGQPYMGSLEAIVAAILFYIFGVSSVALKFTPLIFSIALIPIVYWLGSLVGERYTARWSALFTAIPASPLVVWSSMARGGFIEIICIALIALGLTIMWLQRPSVISTALIGVVLGLGWWVNNQIIYAILPIGFFILFRLWSNSTYPLGPIFRHLTAGIIAFIFGGLPFWIYNLSNDWASFGIFKASAQSDLSEHFAGLLSTSLPMLLGAKLFWHQEDIYPFSSVILLTIFGICGLVLVLMRRSEIFSLLRLKVSNKNSIELLLLFVVLSTIIFASSSYGHLITAPRYLLPILPVIYILLAYVGEKISKYNQLLIGTFFGVLVVSNIYSSYPGKRAIPGQPFVAFNQRASSDHTQLVDWLADHKVELVDTNYWIGYRLAFETKEEVQFHIFQTPAQVRLKSYEDNARQIPIEKRPMILVPAQAELVRMALTLSGYSWAEENLSGYVVIYDRKRGLRPEEISASEFDVTAFSHSEQASEAIDGKLDTRWGSGAPQFDQMWYRIALHRPSKILGLKYEIGNWKTDEPRALKVRAKFKDGSDQEILNESGYKAQRYYFENDPIIDLALNLTNVAEIELEQTGSDSYFDWSIAELSVL